MKILISSNFKRYFNTHIDFIDHYWINFFDSKKYNYQIVPNSLKNLEFVLKNEKKINLIIIPGGNDLFKNNKLTKIRLKIEKILIKHSLKKKIPLLGVCRGMQVINHFFGGKINKISNHMKTNTKIILKSNFFKKKTMKVKCFHNYGIIKKNLPNEFKIIATDLNNNIEMIESKSKKIIGVMWHPERENNYQKLNTIVNKLK